MDEKSQIDIMEMEDAADYGEGWKIDSPYVADWALQKVKLERAENQRLHDIADEQISAIKEKLLEADNRLERKTSFLLGKLREYFESLDDKELKETKTQRTYSLLNGSLVMKKPTATFEKNDEKLVEYLKKSGQSDFIKVEEKPAWGEFKKNIEIFGDCAVDKTTGEIVDCVNVVRQEERFDIK